MSTISADESCWRTSSIYPKPALEIVLIKQTYVMPWSQFLYAEGDSDKVRIIFSTHDVEITGGNMDSLLASIASHDIAQLRQPIRADRFVSSNGPIIREISVKKIDHE